MLDPLPPENARGHRLSWIVFTAACPSRVSRKSAPTIIRPKHFGLASNLLAECWNKFYDGKPASVTWKTARKTSEGCWRIAI